ncbi:MAG: LysE family translocator [Acetobacteraceae bacterium]
MDPGILFLKAAGIGIAIAAPVGPMSLLCMRRSLSLGWRRGLATGLGIATGDGTYALVAAAGLSGLSQFLLLHARPLHLAAALALFYFGLSALRARSAERAAPGRYALHRPLSALRLRPPRHRMHGRRRVRGLGSLVARAGQRNRRVPHGDRSPRPAHDRPRRGGFLSGFRRDRIAPGALRMTEAR